MTRFGYVMVAYFATMATIVTAFIHPSPRLIWNASASVPVGLYRMSSVPAPKVGDLVAVLPPDQLAGFLAERHYLPRGVPMLKHVAGVSGQRVCRHGYRITVDGKYLGDARDRDHLGQRGGENGGGGEGEQAGHRGFAPIAMRASFISRLA